MHSIRASRRPSLPPLERAQGGRLLGRSPELAEREGRAPDEARAPTTIYDWAASSFVPVTQLRAFDDALTDLHDGIAIGNHELWRDPLPPHLAGGAVQLRERIAKRRTDGVEVAQRGVQSGGGQLPFRAQLDRAFGPDAGLDAVRFHDGAQAREACDSLGAAAFATGDSIAFAGAPDLHTVAHEVAHVMQQRDGVQLAGGMGEAGDQYERHADRVADAVVRGDDVSALVRTANTQRVAVQLSPKTCPEEAQTIRRTRVMVTEDQTGQKRTDPKTGEEVTRAVISVTIDFDDVLPAGEASRSFELVYYEGLETGGWKVDGKEHSGPGYWMAFYEWTKQAEVRLANGKARAAPALKDWIDQTIIDLQAARVRVAALQPAVPGESMTEKTVAAEDASYGRGGAPDAKGQAKTLSIDFMDDENRSCTVTGTTTKTETPPKGPGETPAKDPPAPPDTSAKRSDSAGAVHFAINSAVLRKEDLGALDALAAKLVSEPNTKLQINGYTDSTGGAALNQGLSERRAAAVQAYLVGKGVPAERIQVAGRGKAKAEGEKRSERAGNRNASFSTGGTQ